MYSLGNNIPYNNVASCDTLIPSTKWQDTYPFVEFGLRLLPLVS